MNIAFLIDFSPASKLFNAIGDVFYHEGNKTIAICESKLPLVKYNIVPTGDVFIYTELINNIPLGDFDGHSNGFMFSNFDRDSELCLFRNKTKYETDVAIKLLSFFDYIFSNNKPDCVIYENVSNAFSYAAYLMAKKYGIPFFGVIGSRLPGRFELWDNPFGLSDAILKKMKNGLISCDAYDFAEAYLTGSACVPDYMKNNPTSYDVSYIKHYTSKIKELKLIIRLFGGDVYFESKKTIQSPHPLVDIFFRACRVFARKIKLNIINKYFYDDVVDSDKYYLYPLHYHPESSTSVLSPNYVDELNQIKNIAFNLPLGRMLYVKEHPNAVGFKGMCFYRSLSRIPNVKVISHEMNTTKLLDNCVGVITLTSTMGYEALLKGIPTFVFGDVFYNAHPKCINIKNYGDIYPLLSKHQYRDFDSIINRNFVAAYFSLTYPGIVVLNEKSVQFEKSVTDIKHGIEFRLKELHEHVE